MGTLGAARRRDPVSLGGAECNDFVAYKVDISYCHSMVCPGEQPIRHACKGGLVGPGSRQSGAPFGIAHGLVAGGKGDDAMRGAWPAISWAKGGNSGGHHRPALGNSQGVDLCPRPAQLTRSPFDRASFVGQPGVAGVSTGACALGVLDEALRQLLERVFFEWQGRPG